MAGLQQYLVIHSRNVLGDAIKEGDIRLVGGSYLWQGRVEIFLSGVWGTIYSGYASSVDARVVCRQLGYNTLCKLFSDGYIR